MFKIRQLKGATARLKWSIHNSTIKIPKEFFSYNVQFNVQHNLAKHVKNRINITETQKINNSSKPKTYIRQLKKYQGSKLKQFI